MKYLSESNTEQVILFKVKKKKKNFRNHLHSIQMDLKNNNKINLTIIFKTVKNELTVM